MEHEILGHSRKIVKLSRLKGMPIWHKLREISIEIVIIVFAVSLAGYLERLREHDQEQVEVKEFLLGLRTDLKEDITQIREDRQFFKRSVHFMHMIHDAKPKILISSDSIWRYRSTIYYQYKFIPNGSHYGGFKSAGNLGTIEDRKLQASIVRIYETLAPWLNDMTNFRHENMEKLASYLEENVRADENDNPNFDQLLATKRAKINSEISLEWDNTILDAYQQIEVEAEAVIKRINEIYGPESEAHSTH